MATLRERLGLTGTRRLDERPSALDAITVCACRQDGRHYGGVPCIATDREVPLGPSGYCWSCWSARHDLPADTRPEWIRRNIGRAEFGRDETGAI